MIFGVISLVDRYLVTLVEIGKKEGKKERKKEKKKERKKGRKKEWEGKDGKGR